ncbi:MAG: response regulator [Nitrospira defluvii]|nr:response regulator [Nitrospira defluvii]
MAGSTQSSHRPSYDPQVLLNSQPVIVSVIDPTDYTVQFQNRTCLAAFGDIAGASCHEKIAGQASPCEFCRMPEALTREEVVSEEVEMPNGRHLLIHWAKAPTMDGPVHVIETIVDLTKRKQDEQSLRQSQKMEALGRLAAGIAHDFNNLLMVVIGHAQRVAQQLGAHPCHHEVEMIGQAGSRAAALTKKLLTFSRRQVLEQRDVPLNTLIREMEDILRRLIGEQIQTVIVLDPQAGHVLGDSVQIEQVLLNLALNARDAMAEGGILTIETGNVDLDQDYAWSHSGAVSGPYVKLVVEDTGCGIDAETLAHIFEPFFSTKESGQGTGLGLATVYGIVKESRGYIEVTSQPARGTRFTVMLPRALSQLSEVEAVAAAHSVPATCATVLLVEDDEGIRRLVAAVLRDQGYEVLAAADGVEALQMLQVRKSGCDLLITDVILPRMKAAVLVQGAKTMFPLIKVLYISGYAGDMLVSHGVDAQAAYLQKPFLPQALIEKVGEILLPARPS